MNAIHVHLMLTHVPVLGTVFGLGLLLVALWRRSDEVKKVALGVFVLAALFAVPVYLTGEPAEDGVNPTSGSSRVRTCSGSSKPPRRWRKRSAAARRR